MRRVAILLPFLLGLSTGAALADNPPQPPPGYQAAFDTCKSQGLTPGTNDFDKCIAGIVGAPSKGSPPPPPSGGKPGAPPSGGPPGEKPSGPPPSGPPPHGGGKQPSSPAGKAAQSCIQQGLKPNTSALNQCVARALLSPARRSAWDACIAKSLTPLTADFSDCIDSLIHTNRGPALTPRQKDDVDYCLGTGVKAGTKDFAACIRTAGRRKLSAQAQAAVDTCQAQGITDPNALGKCVSALLTVRIPDPPGRKGPKPKDVQAAFTACLDADKKAGTHSFRTCVKKSLNQ